MSRYESCRTYPTSKSKNKELSSHEAQWAIRNILVHFLRHYSLRRRNTWPIGSRDSRQVNLAMLATSPPSTPLVLYDIALRPPVQETCCSPNPWKARMALNFKSLPYSTNWVPLPDVEKVRRGLKLPPCRKFADGTDFFTLPIVEDPNTNSLIGDSFDIATHLQKTYPSLGAGDLFPTQTLDFTHDLASLVPLSDCSSSEFPEYAKFNTNVDGAFTMHVQLTVQGFPFDPAAEEVCKAEFVRRAGVSRFEDFALEGEARRKTMDLFRGMLGGLGKLFQRDVSGPFLLGQTASYGDIIVGAWLQMYRVTLRPSEWEEVRSWHDGLFGRLHDALETFAEVK